MKREDPPPGKGETATRSPLRTEGEGGCREGRDQTSQPASIGGMPNSTYICIRIHIYSRELPTRNPNPGGSRSDSPHGKHALQTLFMIGVRQRSAQPLSSQSSKTPSMKTLRHWVHPLCTQIYPDQPIGRVSRTHSVELDVGIPSTHKGGQPLHTQNSPRRSGCKLPEHQI